MMLRQSMCLGLLTLLMAALLSMKNREKNVTIQYFDMIKIVIKYKQDIEFDHTAGGKVYENNEYTI